MLSIGVHTEASDENTLQLNVRTFKSSGSIKEKGGREIQTADYYKKLSSGYVKAGCCMLELQQLHLSAKILSILGSADIILSKEVRVMTSYSSQTYWLVVVAGGGKDKSSVVWPLIVARVPISNPKGTC